MSIKLPKSLLFIFSFLFLLFLYWPSVKGTPIWDDLTFWFADPILKPETSYIDIWLRYAWPFSVSLQKFLFSMFNKNFLLYHLFNVGVHFANSLLIYHLARMLRFRFPFLIYLLFLLHPANVITTAWMIQIKTLLCFFFGLSSLIAFMKGQKDMKWMAASWALFTLSILSKSASITLPAIFLVISFKQFRFSKLHLLIPFFLLSGASTYRVLKSEVTRAGTEKAASVIQVKDEAVTLKKEIAEVPEKTVSDKKELNVPQKTEPIVAPMKAGVTPSDKATAAGKKKKSETVKTKKPEAAHLPEVKPEPKQDTTVVQQPAREPVKTLPEKKVVINNTDTKHDNWPLLIFSKVNGGLILQTLNYYFWQTILPFENAPVKGLNYEHPGIAEYIHIFFLLSLVIIFLKDINLYYLLAGHFLLIPFLGIMPAPYMNITWVSDQHLYLALPCSLFFWIRIIEKIKWQYSYVLPILFCAYFSYKTFEASRYYKNEMVFFEKSIDYNPYNIPIAYNLAYTYLLQHDISRAYTLLENTIMLAEANPAATKNIYFPHIVSLYIQVQEMIHAR